MYAFYMSFRFHSWILPVALLMATGGACAEGRGWEWVEKSIDTRFPEVRSVTTAALAEELTTADPDEAPILVDSREVAEFAVSHLKGAVNARTVEDFRAEMDGAELSPDRPIVVYCSVGYRSAALSQALEEAGFENVRNLRGSIFAWANEGRPVVSADGPTVAVHPYNRTWGELLDRDRWPEDWKSAR